MQTETAVAAPATDGPREKDPVASVAGQIAVVPTGMRATLRRMNPQRPGAAMAAVIPVLIRAGRTPERTNDDDLRRWAVVCHVAAVLAGASGRAPHDPERRAGRAIHACGYSENRFLRLTSARGPALVDQVVRLARYLAAAGTVPLDLWPIANLVLHDGRDEAKTEKARLDLARGYYAAMENGENTTRNNEKGAIA